MSSTKNMNKFCKKKSIISKKNKNFQKKINNKTKYKLNF